MSRREMEARNYVSQALMLRARKAVYHMQKNSANLPAEGNLLTYHCQNYAEVTNKKQSFSSSNAWRTQLARSCSSLSCGLSWLSK